MKGGSPRNASASVRQRLLNKARADKRPFNELLQYYAMERFLYRLSCSREEPALDAAIRHLRDRILEAGGAVLMSSRAYARLDNNSA